MCRLISATESLVWTTEAEEKCQLYWTSGDLLEYEKDLYGLDSITNEIDGSSEINSILLIMNG